MYCRCSTSEPWNLSNKTIGPVLSALTGCALSRSPEKCLFLYLLPDSLQLEMKGTEPWLFCKQTMCSSSELKQLKYNILFCRNSTGSRFLSMPNSDLLQALHSKPVWPLKPMRGGFLWVLPSVETQLAGIRERTFQ